MNFQSIFQDFQSSSNGTDAFKNLKIQCEKAIQDLDNSLQYSALFLIYSFAKNYVLLYEDQAVTSDFALEAKQQLIDYMLKLNDALQSQDAVIILEQLNLVIKNYNASSKLF